MPNPRRVVFALFAMCGVHAVGGQHTAAEPATAADVQLAKSRIDVLGKRARLRLDEAEKLTEITIEDGADLTADDVALFGRLSDLRALRIQNFRELDDAMVGRLAGLGKLEVLALTNSGITDAGIQTIVQSFPDLVELDLSSNTNLTGAALKTIAGLTKLERLTLLQNRFNDLNTRRLSKMLQLRSLDLRGNMEAGDMTLATVGKLPNLTALKHRSTAVTDSGLADLVASESLESLLMQDFAITSAAGRELAKLEKLSSLEIFRCQGFGSEGVLALAGMPLARLTLRDLPDVGDPALAVLAELPHLKRLYLHELASLGDEGLRHLASAQKLEVLDIWSMPRMTDATVQVIAGLPNVKELSIRETGVTEASVGALESMSTLQSLTFKDNGPLSNENRERLIGCQLKKLDLGSSQK